MTVAASPASRTFEWVLSEHEPGLLRYALGILKDPGQAEDVVQETFLRYLSTSPSPTHLKAWLYRVAHNLSIDHLRKRERIVYLDHASLERDHAVMETEAVEQTHDVLAVIEALPERQRHMLRLKYQEGLSYREISEVTGLSESNVGFILHNTLKTVRHQLQAESSHERNRHERTA